MFYKDVAVVAFKLPAADKSLTDLKAVVTSSGGKFTLEHLTDGDVNKTILLPRDSAAGFAWIQFAFPQSQTIKAITMVGGGYAGIFGMGADPKDSRALEASDDGLHFKVRLLDSSWRRLAANDQHTQHYRKVFPGNCQESTTKD